MWVCVWCDCCYRSGNICSQCGKTAAESEPYAKDWDTILFGLNYTSSSKSSLLETKRLAHDCLLKGLKLRGVVAQLETRGTASDICLAQFLRNLKLNFKVDNCDRNDSISKQMGSPRYYFPIHHQGSRFYSQFQQRI